MSWRDYIAPPREIVYPWVGGRALWLLGGERLRIEGALPIEWGWYRARLSAGRTAEILEPTEDRAALGWLTRGYLVGDRLVPDGVSAATDPRAIAQVGELAHLIEPGLDRFTRIVAGRVSESRPLVYAEPDMPLGPEADVLSAYLDGVRDLSNIRGVPPALDLAFRLEVHQRDEAARRRQEIERERREAEARREREARLQELREKSGDAELRRELARVDFAEAARSALAVGGAEYLDHRVENPGTMAVRYRLASRRFECTCDANTLRIVDAGICVVDEDHDEHTGSRFTLESLPSVVLEAIEEGILVVLRRV